MFMSKGVENPMDKFRGKRLILWHNASSRRKFGGLSVDLVGGMYMHVLEGYLYGLCTRLGLLLCR